MSNTPNAYVAPKGAAFTFYEGLYDALATITNAAVVYPAVNNVLKSTPTIATGDFKISKDGGAFANMGTLPAVTPASGRAVKFVLSAAEMNADFIVIQCVDAAGAEWSDKFITIKTYLDDTARYGYQGA